MNIANKLDYFLRAWEWQGVGTVIAYVQDGPNSGVELTKEDLYEILDKLNKAGE